MLIGFDVQDHPAPQGSKRHVGHGRMIESSKHVRPWREAVKESALKAAAEWLTAQDQPGPVIIARDIPVFVDMTFRHHRPKGHYRTGRNSHLLKDNAPEFVTVYPDVSKLIRSTEDAITAAQIWADDAQVVDVHAVQIYTDQYPEGAAVTIRWA